MKRKHEYEAIKAILAAIDDDQMPATTKVRNRPDETVVWFGGMGRALGSAKRDGRNEPLIYRDRAAHQAIELEAVCRLDAKRQSGDA